MKAKVTVFFEIIGVIASVIVLIFLIILLVLVVGLKFVSFKDYPMIIVGLGASLTAFLGVVVSQIWNTYNTNKHIENQIAGQLSLLEKQKTDSLEIQKQKMNDEAIAKERSDKEQEQKEFYLGLLQLKDMVRQHIESSYMLAKLKIDEIYCIKVMTHSNGEMFDVVDLATKKYNDMFLKTEEIKNKISEVFHRVQYLVEIKEVCSRTSYYNVFRFLNDIHDMDNKYIKVCNNLEISPLMINIVNEKQLPPLISYENKIHRLGSQKRLAQENIEKIKNDWVKKYNSSYIEDHTNHGFCFNVDNIVKILKR